MKIGTGILLLFIGIIIGCAGMAIYDHYAGRPISITVTPQAEQKPVLNNNITNTAALLCGPTIKIGGVLVGKDVFHVTAANNCMTIYRDFTIGVKCARPRWSILLQIPIGESYVQDTKKFDTLLGVMPGFIKWFGPFGIGASAIYQQSLFTKYKFYGGSLNIALDIL